MQGGSQCEQKEPWISLMLFFLGVVFSNLEKFSFEQPQLLLVYEFAVLVALAQSVHTEKCQAQLFLSLYTVGRLEYFDIFFLGQGAVGGSNGSSGKNIVSWVFWNAHAFAYTLMLTSTYIIHYAFWPILTHCFKSFSLCPLSRAFNWTRSQLKCKTILVAPSPIPNSRYALARNKCEFVNRPLTGAHE